MQYKLVALFMLLGILGLYAQHTVSGTVTGAGNEPLAGVNIQEAGTANGAATNREGFYELSVQSPTATLIFSYTGYTTVEIRLSGQSKLDVTMAEDVIQLGDVGRWLP